MCRTARRILILDDETSIRLSLAAFFEDRGWHVRTAAEAEEALEILKGEPMDIVIVDIRLTGMSGDGFMRTALQMDLDVVFVVCTGATDYVLPQDLAAVPQICETVFRKPLADMESIEREINNLLTDKTTG